VSARGEGGISFYVESLVIIVDNRVRVCGVIPAAADKRLRQMTTYANPKRAALESMGFPVWGEPRTIETFRQEQTHLSFARGTYRRVVLALRAENVPFVTRDQRCSGTIIPWEDGLPPYGRTLWPHQEAVVEAMIARQNCIVRAPTGSGKTSCGLAFASRVGVPTLVVVPTGTLFDQWIERCRDPRELNLRMCDVGMIRGKKKVIKPITIAMQQTLARHGIGEREKQIFGAVIEDEVQFAPAKTFFDAIDPWPAKFRIGISADERRKDRMDFMTRDLFGEIGHEVSRQEVEAAGHIMEVELRCVPSRFDASWYHGDAIMPSFDELVAEDGGPSAKHEFGDDGDRFGRLLREMASDSEREALIDRWIMYEVEAGRQVLVFCRRREHVLQIDQRISGKGVRTGIILGGSGEDERVRRKTIAEIKSGVVRVAIGTVEACGTGTDLPSVEAGVVTFPLHTNRQLIGQVRGRICRVSGGKEVARLYMVTDERVFPGQVRALARAHGGLVLRWSGSSWENVGNKKRAAASRVAEDNEQ